MHKLLSQIARFGFVGATATLLDYSLFAILARLFNMNYILANTLSFSVSTVFNYLASMRFVFTHRDDLKRKTEFAIFSGLSVASLCFNNILMWICVDLLAIESLIAKIIATIIVTAFNFVTRKALLDND